MLASSPSPSAALRPGSSSSPSAHSLARSNPHSHPRPSVISSTSSQPATSPSLQASPAYRFAHDCHYEPARTAAIPPTSGSSSSNNNNNNNNNTSQFSPRSSRVAIEELRSALNKQTVESSPHGPSGDLPRGRMSAGLNSLGGGSHPTGSHSGLASASENSNSSQGVNGNQGGERGDGGNDGNPLSGPTGQASVSMPAKPRSTTTTTTASPTTANTSAGSNSSTAPVPPAASTPTSSVPPVMPARASSGSNKRNSRDELMVDADDSGSLASKGSQSKRLRPSKPTSKVLPREYDQADPRDIVVLISSMLLELIRFNDNIPLHQGRLTRFHSRSPPRISVQDYLQRLATHATLSPPILLSMVYYIDRLCALYPAFNVSSLTIHRFLIASATVASKGLSDSFWTNKTYARVGGISLTELALLELEFLFRVEWRIVPQPEVLVDYYQSLVERCDGYEIARD